MVYYQFICLDIHMATSRYRHCSTPLHYKGVYNIIGSKGKKVEDGMDVARIYSDSACGKASIRTTYRSRFGLFTFDQT
jgi:hypothetical protein